MGAYGCYSVVGLCWSCITVFPWQRHSSLSFLGIPVFFHCPFLLSIASGSAGISHRFASNFMGFISFCIFISIPSCLSFLRPMISPNSPAKGNSSHLYPSFLVTPRRHDPRTKTLYKSPKSPIAAYSRALLANVAELSNQLFLRIMISNLFSLFLCLLLFTSVTIWRPSHYSSIKSTVITSNT